MNVNVYSNAMRLITSVNLNWDNALAYDKFIFMVDDVRSIWWKDYVRITTDIYEI